MWCCLSTKTHFSKQISLKALPCSPADITEVISVCSFSLSPIWLSRGTEKDSCSAACHSPALETCSLVQTAHANKQNTTNSFTWMPSCIILQKPLGLSWLMTAGDMALQHRTCAAAWGFWNQYRGVAPLTLTPRIPISAMRWQATVWSPLRAQKSLGTSTECHLKPLGSSFKGEIYTRNELKRRESYEFCTVVKQPSEF